MDILVYGAGVIGTLYAARLQSAGYNVKVLARAERRTAIENHGLIIEDVVTGIRSMIPVPTVERLAAEDRYDFVLIAVRRDQLASLMPELKANPNVPTMLFMLNNPLGTSELAGAFGSERVLLGFPGAGGTFDGPIVRYTMIEQQPTTLGELNGRETGQLNAIVKALEVSGFRTRTERDMDAWLKTHAFFITAIGGALYLAGGDCNRLSRDKATLKLMTRGVREGFRALRALGCSVRPLGLKVLFEWMPPAFAVSYWRRSFSNALSEYMFGYHVRSSSSEMRAVADDCRVLLEKSGMETPALVQLYRAIDTYAAAGQ